MSFLNHLSADLCLFIASYVDYSDQISLGSCCFHFYQTLIVDHLRILKVTDSSKFLDNYFRSEALQERVKKAIKFPQRQLDLFQRSPQNSERLPFKIIHRLECEPDIFDQHLSSKVDRVEILSIWSMTHLHKALNLLKKDYQMKELKLSVFNNDEHRSPVPSIPSSVIRLCVEGKFLMSNITMQQFSNLQCLHLHSLDTLTDVSMLGNIDSIHFHQCGNLINITPLQNNRIVSIHSCSSILDYRNAFSHTKRLVIHEPNFNALLDVGKWSKVESLALHARVEVPLPKKLPPVLRRLSIGGIISPTSNFSQLFEFELHNPEKFTDVKLLGRIPVLKLFVLQVKSLVGLGYSEDLSQNLRNRRVEIHSFPQLADFSPLNTVDSVVIDGCNYFQRSEDVCDVKCLYISYCKIVDINTEMRNEKLTITGPMNSINFHYLRHVKELDISEVRFKTFSLKDIPTLHRLERLIIFSSISLDPKEWKYLVGSFIFYPQYPYYLKVICVRKMRTIA